MGYADKVMLLAAKCVPKELPSAYITIYIKKKVQIREVNMVAEFKNKGKAVKLFIATYLNDKKEVIYLDTVGTLANRYIKYVPLPRIPVGLGNRALISRAH